MKFVLHVSVLFSMLFQLLAPTRHHTASVSSGPTGGGLKTSFHQQSTLSKRRPTLTMIRAKAQMNIQSTSHATPSSTGEDRITFSLKEDTVVAGTTLHLDWNIVYTATIETPRLFFYLPNGIEPIAGQSLKRDNEDDAWILIPGATNGSITMHVLPTAFPPYDVTVELHDGKTLLARETRVWKGPSSWEVTKAGGQAASADGRVIVQFPEGAVQENVQVTISDAHLQTPYILAGQPFKINAITAQGNVVNTFSRPLTITVAYSESELNGNETNLWLYYYDSNAERWTPLPSKVDLDTDTLYAYTTHFTIFDFDAQSWQAARLPSLDAFQVSSFTGSAAHTFSFWTPPGPGGLQPSLVLNYNSQIVDSASFETQGGWVGMGWFLNIGSIERNMHGTNDNLQDDTFTISTGNVTRMLLPVAEGNNNVPPDVTVFRSADETFWRVWAHNLAGTNSWWEAWDKTGNHFVFGDRMDYPAWNFDDGCDYFRVNWKWNLTQETNPAGRSLIYEYEKDFRSVAEMCEDGRRVNLKMASYPVKITYPQGKYQIRFNLENRSDYELSWENLDSRIFFEKRRLDSIDILYGDDADGDGWLDALVRRYDLTYMPDNNPAGHVMPGHAWTAGGRTITLAAITEQDMNGNTLPSTTFSYDTLHLIAATNGYGGQVDFFYGQWYETQFTERDFWADPLTDDFGKWYGNHAEPCGKPSGRDKPGDPSPWKKGDENSEVECSHNRENLEVTGSAYKILQAPYVRPGAVYHIAITGGNEETQIGLEGGNGTSTVYLPTGVKQGWIYFTSQCHQSMGMGFLSNTM